MKETTKGKRGRKGEDNEGKDKGTQISQFFEKFFGLATTPKLKETTPKLKEMMKGKRGRKGEDDEGKDKGIRTGLFLCLSLG